MSNPVSVSQHVLFEVLAERVKQDNRWGEQNHPNGSSIAKYGPLAEKIKAENDKANVDHNITWAAILEEEFYEACAEEDPDAIRRELVQVAAVAAGWIEAIDRAKLRGKGGA